MSDSKRPGATTLKIHRLSKKWVTTLNLHWAGLGLLALVNLYLILTMGILWQASRSRDADALSAQRVKLQAAQIAARPLEGLDAKLARANRQADSFYEQRLPVSYSEVATELGVLKDKNNVRLAGNTYGQAPVTVLSTSPTTGGSLTEVRMDANLSGDYRGLVEFLNGLERDKVFFVVNGLTLTGQESGRVNLRMKLTTYLRGLSSDEEAAQASTVVAPTEEMENQVLKQTGGSGGRP